MPFDDYYRDSYYASLPDGVMTDGYTKSGTALHTNDEDLGGTSNLIVSEIEITETLIHYKIQRKLITGDPYDIKLYYNVGYGIHWFLGKRDANGKDIRPSYADNNHEFFALSLDYEDRNRDESGHHGD